MEAAARLQKTAAREPDSADVQNLIGYSYRNLGKYDLAFKHYKLAIGLDPRHRGAHEYIGETYLLTGDLASASKHLEVLRGICLIPCEELKDLERAVAAYKRSEQRYQGLGIFSVLLIMALPDSRKRIASGWSCHGPKFQTPP